jgi:membrane protein DedA with SNARE-associated domain
MRRPGTRTLVVAGLVAVVVAVLVVLYVTLEPNVSEHRVRTLFREHGLLVVFIPVFLETAGVPLPGETILLLAGVAASTGDLQLVPAIVVASIAAILGDNVGYAVGRYGGRRLVVRLAHFGRVDQSLGWGERFFERHGGKTVFMARWIAGLRIFGAWIAGMVHMPWRKFALWNALGGITWATSVILAGYLFAKSLGRIKEVFGVGGAVIAGVVAVVGVVALVRHERRTREADHEAGG